MDMQLQLQVIMQQGILFLSTVALLEGGVVICPTRSDLRVGADRKTISVNNQWILTKFSTVVH